MSVLDAREKSICIGSYVRYTRTGTVGEVTAIEINDNKYWIKLSKSDLWYLPEYIEILNEEDFDFDAIDFKDRQKDVDVEDITDIRDDFENMELSSNVAEGGG